MGLFVCLSLCLSVTLPLQCMQNFMSKENSENQPERKLEAKAKHAPSNISLYTQSFEAEFT